MFRLNQGEVLRRSQLLDTWWEQERLQLGVPFRANLEPGTGGRWDLELVLPPRSAMSWTQDLLVGNALSAAFHQEVRIAYPLELASGRQASATWRWDSKLRHVGASIGIPYLTFGANRLSLGADWKDEDWHHTDSGERFTQETVLLTGEQEYVFQGRKAVSFGVGYLRQSLRFPEPAAGDTAHFVTVSVQWNQRLGLNKADTLRLDIQGRYDDVGARQANAFIRLPWDLGSRTSVEISLRGGAAEKRLPLSRHFVLGVGLDHPLPLQAHSAVEDGRKGNGPMGRSFALVNLEMRRRLLRAKWLDLTGVMFSDTAAVRGAPFGSQRTIWYQDIGGGVRIGALGKDLLDIRVGADVKVSSFNLWIGVPK